MTKQKIVTKLPVAAAAVLIMMLCACGETKSERAVSGAGIGAGVGAVGGALTGGSIGGGALVGGLAGGAAGALISPNAVDLGKPIWR